MLPFLFSLLIKHKNALCRYTEQRKKLLCLSADVMHYRWICEIDLSRCAIDGSLVELKPPNALSMDLLDRSCKYRSIALRDQWMVMYHRSSMAIDCCLHAGKKVRLNRVSNSPSLESYTLTTEPLRWFRGWKKGK